MNNILIGFLLCIFVLPLAAKEQNSQVVEFAKFDKFENVKISPNGDYLAVSMNEHNAKRMIGIIDLKTMAFSSTVNLENKEIPGEFVWVNDNRIALKVLYDKLNDNRHSWYGEWFAMNADGTQKAEIMDHTSADGWGEIIDVLSEDSKHILVLVRDYGLHAQKHPEIFKLNVYNGRLRKEARAPIRGARVLADNHHQVRFAVGTDAEDQNRFKIYHRPKKNQDWVLLNVFESLDGNIFPLSFADENEVYLLSDEQSNTSSIYKYNLDTKKSELIYNHEKVDITSIFYSGSGEPIAVRIDPDKPALHFLNKTHKISRWIFSLQEHFPDHLLTLRSATTNDSKFILEVSSDTNPGDFYLIDTVKESVNFLLSRKPSLDKKSLLPMQAVTMLARDKTQLNGYITLPKDFNESTPLVVYPHGGPHGVRDYWEFQPDVQFLAAEGAAVLQVNYRGSHGYGKKFKGAGIKEWGGKMVTDVIDATNWSQQKFNFSKKNICIMGGSYGAFAALMAATMEPDLYKCVVLKAGVYDLVAMTGNKTSWIAEKYFEDVLGKDETILKKQSPINYLHKLNAPIFLLHGERDNIAKFEQAENLVETLQKMNKKVKSRYFKKEGHGWLGFENRVEAYERTAEFIFDITAPPL